jgi:GNAT superfamily N-acetyltransferase
MNATLAQSGESHPNTAQSYSLHELAVNSPDSLLASARELLREYGRFVVAQPSISSFCYGDLEREAANLPQSYLDKPGGAIVAIQNDHPIGFVAWRSLPDPNLANAWELKRLWLRAEARGSGIGRALIQAVLDRAKANAKSVVLLDTAPDAMATAHKLYLQMGFVECPPYNGRSSDAIIYMQKRLENS